MYVTVDAVREVVTRDPYRPQNTAAALTDGQIETAIANAQAEVDGRLRGRYTVPFDPVPALVAVITLDIAAYLVALTFYQEKELPDTDPAVRRHDRACALLMDVANANIDLDGGDGGAPAPHSGDGTMGSAVPRRDGPLFGLADFGLACRYWW